ncbi:hypothetical protein SAMN02800687_2079 [Curtobacterium sp. UNCCL20]|uniref:hypothetical protein n=1 Tax=Curtobacterium sp. UNCCL20 TaxID=1502773 RepID=UPI000883D915|nr:hypothetical protein [Curtobacterium sp. UNCCL20]SDQ60832.1 hypothetical protein SAMN02800687_2079 [Curtobacterium sp. UNCCL20]
MTDSTPTNPSDRPERSEQHAPAGWGAAPTPTSTATLDTPAPPAAPVWNSWQPGQPNGATPWYGAAATAKRRGPKPPWFWPVVLVSVGLAALLAGGGIGFAVGHAIGGASQSTTQLPGTGGGTNRFPGGGTGQFPGSGTQGGTGTGTGTGSGTGSDSSGSSSNS